MRTPILPPRAKKEMARVFADYPELKKVILFGSRATGKADEHSDIDIATVGIVDARRFGDLAMDLEDTNIPQICDVKAYEDINYAPLKRHIDTVGLVIYEAGRDDS